VRALIDCEKANARTRAFYAFGGITPLIGKFSALTS
jgi:hypothetical protein